jgi:hypothetical protein
MKKIHKMSLRAIVWQSLRKYTDGIASLFLLAMEQKKHLPMADALIKDNM